MCFNTDGKRCIRGHVEGQVEECFVVMYGRSNPVVSQKAQLSLAQLGWEWWKSQQETELGRVLHKFTYTVIIQL